MKQIQVIARQRAPDRPEIRIEPGASVTLGERDTEWPQLAWTVLAAGLGGRAPAMRCDRDSGDTTALQSCDTRELAADEAERVLLHHELATCWRAGNNHGTCGWIPTHVLRILDDSDHPET